MSQLINTKPMEIWLKTNGQQSCWITTTFLHHTTAPFELVRTEKIGMKCISDEGENSVDCLCNLQCLFAMREKDKFLSAWLIQALEEKGSTIRGLFALFSNFPCIVGSFSSFIWVNVFWKWAWFRQAAGNSVRSDVKPGRCGCYDSLAVAKRALGVGVKGTFHSEDDAGKTFGDKTESALTEFVTHTTTNCLCTPSKPNIHRQVSRRHLSVCFSLGWCTVGLSLWFVLEFCSLLSGLSLTLAPNMVECNMLM